jgi:ketosteroid isomerase-like protein
LRKRETDLLPDAKKFAEEWIESWNSHDLDRILSHYSEDVEVTTPMIKVAMGVDSGTLRGKDLARQYWQAALERAPDLHFELVELTQSIESIALYYRSVQGKMAIEVMFFDENGKVSRVIAHYN